MIQHYWYRGYSYGGGGGAGAFKWVNAQTRFSAIAPTARAFGLMPASRSYSFDADQYLKLVTPAKPRAYFFNLVTPTKIRAYSFNASAYLNSVTPAKPRAYFFNLVTPAKPRAYFFNADQYLKLVTPAKPRAYFFTKG